MDALAGLRVVDWSNGLCGALVSQLLADHGAEVIRIDSPRGDALRGQPAWYFWQRGKKSVVLDLSEPPDRDRAQQLAEGADVFVETFRRNLFLMFQIQSHMFKA